MKRTRTWCGCGVVGTPTCPRPPGRGHSHRRPRWRLDHPCQLLLLHLWQRAVGNSAWKRLVARCKMVGFLCGRVLGAQSARHSNIRKDAADHPHLSPSALKCPCTSILKDLTLVQDSLTKRCQACKAHIHERAPNVCTSTNAARTSHKYSQDLTQMQPGPHTSSCQAEEPAASHAAASPGSRWAGASRSNGRLPAP
jgi:hypothetical protein